MSRGTTRVFRALMMLGAMAGLTNAALAGASFNTFASSTLEIITIVDIPDAGVPVTLGTVPADLSILGGAGFTPLTSTVGNAGASTGGSSATPSAGTSLDVGDKVQQVANITGFAIQPPDSSASASVDSQGMISLSNSSTDHTYVVVFKLAYQYNVNASGDNAFNDSASADVSISLDTTDGLNFNVFEEMFSETNGGALFDTDSFIFTLVVPSSATDELTVGVNTSGQATSLVPEPAAAMVWGMGGFIGMGLLRRKR